MVDLFETPIAYKYINKKATAYKYRNGTININGEKYLCMSITEAIKRYLLKLKINKIQK